MKNITKICLATLILLMAVSCKKDNGDEKDYNMLKVESGSISGFSYTFSPNMGFWSPVNATTKYVHLVFGDTDNMTVSGKDILSLLFYHEGQGSVSFPSAQGQHANFGITVEGTEKYFIADGATLSVSELTDTRFIGTLTGTFVNISNSSELITVLMDIDIQMTGIF